MRVKNRIVGKLVVTSNSLPAKCARSFLEVHGKVQSTFKPDYQVLLVRLIAADGTEYDRKDLKIADADRYDKEPGQYAVPTELILHGWCALKCADSTCTPCGNPK